MVTSLIGLLFCLLAVQSKRRFERDCKEAERAQHVSDRIDLENKTDGEKVEKFTPTSLTLTHKHEHQRLIYYSRIHQEEVEEEEEVEEDYNLITEMQNRLTVTLF